MVSFHSNGTVTKVYDTMEFYSPISFLYLFISFAGKWLPLDIIVQAILYKKKNLLESEEYKSQKKKKIESPIFCLYILLKWYF